MRSEPIITMMAESVVRSQAACLALAQSQALIRIRGADSVLLKDVNIRNVAEASVACKFEHSIDLKPAKTDLAKELQGLIAAPDGREGDKGNVIRDITESLDAGVVSECISSALNEYELLLDNIGGDVTLYDLDIEQIAQSHIEKCVARVTIGGRPMADHLEDVLEPFQINTFDPVLCAESAAIQSRGRKVTGWTVAGAIIIVVLFAIYMLLR